MKINLGTMAVLSVLLISGCGDQVWCGKNGCGADSDSNLNRSTRAIPAPVRTQNDSILKNML